MTCDAVIATRTGLHLRCILELDEKGHHDGDCVPNLAEALAQLQCIPQPRPRPRLPIPDVVQLQESTFLSHLLNILEAALPSPIGAPLFTGPEAIKLARSLIWQRLGRESPF